MWPPRSTLSWTEYPLGTAESDVPGAGFGAPGVAFRVVVKDLESQNNFFI
jgi:hypothetical protein